MDSHHTHTHTPNVVAKMNVHYCINNITTKYEEKTNVRFLDYQPNHRDSGEDVCTYLGDHHNNHVCVEDAYPLNDRPKIYSLDLYRRRDISQLFIALRGSLMGIPAASRHRYPMTT